MQVLSEQIYPDFKYPNVLFLFIELIEYEVFNKQT